MFCTRSFTLSPLPLSLLATFYLLPRCYSPACLLWALPSCLFYAFMILLPTCLLLPTCYACVPYEDMAVYAVQLFGGGRQGHASVCCLPCPSIHMMISTFLCLPMGSSPLCHHASSYACLHSQTHLLREDRRSDQSSWTGHGWLTSLLFLFSQHPSLLSSLTPLSFFLLMLCNMPHACLSMPCCPSISYFSNMACLPHFFFVPSHLSPLSQGD